MQKKISWIAFLVLIGSQFNQVSTASSNNGNDLKLWLTISAEKRFLEVSWINAPAYPDDNIIITKQSPESFHKIIVEPEQVSGNFYTAERSVTKGDENRTGLANTITTPSTKYEEDELGSGSPMKIVASNSNAYPPSRTFWISNHGRDDIVAAIKPSASSQWFTTGVLFDYKISENITKQTKCYGYWASYIDDKGEILTTSCLKTHATWMHDLRPLIGNLRFRDLFILGSHDSGSYRTGFDPLLQETIITKYALTQDDDIKNQLMHGVRYLDIRVGYYRQSSQMFFINHGITRQIPLMDVIDQVKEFVYDTNELIIFGLKEFPIGFKKNLSVHHLLVQYLRESFGELIVHPSASWSASLNDIWSRKQNVILAYDHPAVVREYPDLLFTPVDQRWGNVQKWSDLESYLKKVHNYDTFRLSSRPVADMAEVTPDTWGIVLDKYGGLRKLADRFNWRVSQLYRDKLGNTANIVAVDFIRGTNLMELSLDFNKAKTRY